MSTSLELASGVSLAASAAAVLASAILLWVTPKHQSVVSISPWELAVECLHLIFKLHPFLSLSLIILRFWLYDPLWQAMLLATVFHYCLASWKKKFGRVSWCFGCFIKSVLMFERESVPELSKFFAHTTHLNLKLFGAIARLITLLRSWLDDSS